MLESHKNTFLLETSHCYCFNSFSFSCPPLEDRGNSPWVLFHSISYIELFTSWDQAFLFVCRGILSLFSDFFFSLITILVWVSYAAARGVSSHSQCSKVSFFLFPKASLFPKGTLLPEDDIPRCEVRAPPYFGLSFLLGWERQWWDMAVLGYPLLWRTLREAWGVCVPLPVPLPCLLSWGSPSGELLLAFVPLKSVYVHDLFSFSCILKVELLHKRDCKILMPVFFQNGNTTKFLPYQLCMWRPVSLNTTNIVYSIWKYYLIW